MGEVHGKPYHPQTQGKVERLNRSIKNVVKLENYYLPGELELAIGNFFEHYNHHRYHESLDNLTPADVHFGRAASINQARERVKAETLRQRKRYNQGSRLPVLTAVIVEGVILGLLGGAAGACLAYVLFNNYRASTWGNGALLEFSFAITPGLVVVAL